MFRKHPVPVLVPSAEPVFSCPVTLDQVAWMSENVYNPSAVVKDEQLHLFYRADSPYGEGLDDVGNRKMTCRIGHAVSDDGIHFRPFTEPVLYPDNDEYLPFEWWGGCQDLHIVEGQDGRYYMNYDGWSGIYDGRYEYGHCPTDPIQDVLLTAVSEDLTHWRKMGPAFPEAYRSLWNHSRSGTVICRLRDNRLIAEKIDGKYWMYMSHRGYLAFSEDLIHWKPILREDGCPACLFSEYPALSYCGCSCEAGTAAIITTNGIYYGFNALSQHGEAWSLGAALIDKQSLLHVLNIEPEPYLQPEYIWERHGHCGCPATVCNTVVWFANEWRIYYGAADHVIGMATWDKSKEFPPVHS